MRVLISVNGQHFRKLLMKKAKGLSKTTTSNTLIDTDSSVVIPRGKVGWEEVEEGEGGINGDGRRLDLGWWAHNTIYI